MDFQQQVLSMKMSEIMSAMIEGLKDPKVKLDMNYYGTTRTVKKFFGLIEKEICFGCAATNTICQITKKVFSKESINSVLDRALFINSGGTFLSHFEQAINELRKGNINNYNLHAEQIGMATMPVGIYTCSENSFPVLPILRTDYKKEELDVYICFVEALKLWEK